MRIMSSAIVLVFGNEVVGTFAHVESTDTDCPGRLEASHSGGILGGGRVVAVDFGTCNGDFSRNVEKVLDGERHTGQRAGIFAGCDQRIDFLGFLSGSLSGHQGKGVELALCSGDLLE